MVVSTPTDKTSSIIIFWLVLECFVLLDALPASDVDRIRTSRSRIRRLIFRYCSISHAWWNSIFSIRLDLSWQSFEAIDACKLYSAVLRRLDVMTNKSEEEPAATATTTTKRNIKRWRTKEKESYRFRMWGGSPWSRYAFVSVYFYRLTQRERKRERGREKCRRKQSNDVSNFVVLGTRAKTHVDRRAPMLMTTADGRYYLLATLYHLTLSPSCSTRLLTLFNPTSSCVRVTFWSSPTSWHVLFASDWLNPTDGLIQCHQWSRWTEIIS